MAIFHAYFDESGKKSDHPVVTFSAICLPQSKLQAFDDAWKALLRTYQIPALHMALASRLSRKYGPLMPANQTETERIEGLKEFADCINAHAELGLMQAMEVKGFNALSKNARAKLGSPTDPYYIAFMRGVLEIIDYIGEDDRVSLICDDDAETALDCYRHYRALRRASERIRKKTISLSFADDTYFPSLQAADMVAFLSRLEAKRHFYRDHYSFPALFYHMVKERGSGNMAWRKVFLDENKMKEISDRMDKRSSLHQERL
jgi:hypothetical protein